MAGLRTVLARWRQRFRPVSTPGPAATGVPADRSAELAAELGPCLALLEGVHAQAAGVRERAEQEAARIRSDAAQRAAGIEAAAAEQAAAVRREAAARVLADAASQGAELLARGEREAAAVTRRAGERIPALADRVVAGLLGEPAAAGGPGSRPDAEGRIAQEPAAGEPGAEGCGAERPGAEGPAPGGPGATRSQGAAGPGLDHGRLGSRPERRGRWAPDGSPE